MDIKAIHEKIKDRPDHTVEGQIRWLEKQGFSLDQIDSAMLKVYFDIERGCIPCKWDTGSEVVYMSGDTPKSGEHWTGGPIDNTHDLDRYLLQVAKEIRTLEYSDKVKRLGEQVAKMKEQWEKDYKKANEKPGFFKRLFSRTAQ